VLLAAHAAGADVRPSGRDRTLILANAALVAAAIVASLGFEEIGLDLIVIVLLAALSEVLLRATAADPVLRRAYVAGLRVTLAVRAA
jgi:hypothetical protein